MSEQQDTATPSQEAAKVETPVEQETPQAQPQSQSAEPTPQADSPLNDIAPPSEPTPQPDTPAEPQQEPVPERVVPAADGYTLPEGVPAEFGELANKLDYTQEQAEGSLQAFSQYIGAMNEGLKQSNVEAFTTFTKDMDDSQLSELKSDAKKGLEYIDEDGQLAGLLKESNGFDFNPIILTRLAKVGKMLREGSFVRGSSNTPRKTDNQSRAHRMYPNDAPGN